MRTVGAALRFVVVLGMGVALAFVANRPPAPLGADAPPTVFSAARARADLTWIAAEPHGAGTPAEDKVRQRLIQRLGELGLKAEVQHVDGVAITNRRPEAPSSVALDNVFARLEGSDPAAPALALMAHYDSVPRSPGAADDGAGVASLLEIARVLKARSQPPPRDLVFVFTDGEELGLLGAQQFFHDHPLARRVGAVVNLEARGGAGPAFLFETGPGSDELVRAFAKLYPRASSTSFATFVYDHMPNGTDFTVPKREGLPGLNFAFIGDPVQYHSELSTPDALSMRSLQHIGEEALAAVDVLEGRGELQTPGPTLAWSDLLGRRLIVYAPPVGWAILGACGLFLLIAIVRLARRREGAALPGNLARSLGLIVATIVVGGALLFAAVPLAHPPGRPGREFLLACTRFEIALLCIAVGAMLLCARLASRDRDGTRLGLLLWALTGAAVLQALQPRLALPLAWPLLIASLGMLSIGRTVLDGVWGTITAGLATALCLHWAHSVYLALGVFLPPAVVPFVLLTTLAALPVLTDLGTGRFGRSLAVLVIGVGLGLALSIRFA
jgi:hypothetical protein